ncbi:hypothetical protein ACQPZX_38445 [Actinoplanes sp. CA-142083]|uniref:hypothetical protein n=1 Tax=Actinoplanes sp. CA-142083 TaxID=3239903 RepID=UPI003D9231E3
MRIPLVSPAADLARAAIGQAVESAAAAVTLPLRVLGVLGQTELLVSRITVLADEAEALIRRVNTIVTDAEGVVAEARVITQGASAVVGQAGGITHAASAIVGEAAGITDAAAGVITRASSLSQAAEGVIVSAGGITADATAVVRQAESAAGDATELLDAYAGTLRKGAPLAARFVDELSPAEVTAAIRMVDTLPQLRDHLVNDVMPLLSKLDQVGPDIHKLLEVTEDLHLAIAGIPGLRLLRRRGEEREKAGEIPHP